MSNKLHTGTLSDWNRCIAANLFSVCRVLNTNTLFRSGSSLKWCTWPTVFNENTSTTSCVKEEEKQHFKRDSLKQGSISNYVVHFHLLIQPFLYHKKKWQQLLCVLWNPTWSILSMCLTWSKLERHIKKMLRHSTTTKCYLAVSSWPTRKNFSRGNTCGTQIHGIFTWVIPEHFFILNASWMQCISEKCMCTV